MRPYKNGFIGPTKESGQGNVVHSYSAVATVSKWFCHHKTHIDIGEWLEWRDLVEKMMAHGSEWPGDARSFRNHFDS